jgi:hypothetical protein
MKKLGFVIISILLAIGTVHAEEVVGEDVSDQ